MPLPFLEKIKGMDAAAHGRLFCETLKCVGVSMQNCSRFGEPCAVSAINLLDWTSMYDQWNQLNNIFTKFKRGLEHNVLGVRLWFRPDLAWCHEGTLELAIECEKPPAPVPGVAIEIWHSRMYCGKVMGAMRTEHEAWMVAGPRPRRGVLCVRTMTQMCRPSPFPATEWCGPPALPPCAEARTIDSDADCEDEEDEDSSDSGFADTPAGADSGLFGSDSESESDSSGAWSD